MKSNRHLISGFAVTKDRSRSRPHRPISFILSSLSAIIEKSPRQSLPQCHQCEGRGRLANPRRTNIPDDLVRAGASTDSCAIWAQYGVLERTPLWGENGSLPWLVISASTKPALQLILGFLRGNIHILVEVHNAGTITPKFATGGPQHRRISLVSLAVWRCSIILWRTSYYFLFVIRHVGGLLFLYCIAAQHCI